MDGQPLISEAQELQRVEARRRRENERLKSLGPGRLRSIGADIAGLKAQLHEKQLHNEQMKNLEQEEAAEGERIRRALFQLDEQQHSVEAKEAVKLTRFWDAQRQQRMQHNQQEHQFFQKPTVVQDCGVSAAQGFEGEDPQKTERERLQRLQLSQWLIEQQKERESGKLRERMSESEYREYIIQVNNVQEQLEEAMARTKARAAMDVKSENVRQMEERRHRMEMEQALESQLEQMELESTINGVLLSEQPVNNGLQDQDGRRVRVDHWKGLSKQQTRAFLNKNDTLIRQKLDELDQERKEVEEEKKRNDELRKNLVQWEVERERQAIENTRNLVRTREQQIKEQQEREEENRRNARGKIEPEFFMGFGRSYR